VIVRRAATLGRYRSQASLAALLVANAIPLLGVLFFGWSLITILVLYWLENGIIGLWNIPRIALARGDDRRTSPMIGHSSQWFIIPFFLLHYGLFWVGQGVFLAFLPAMSEMGTFANSGFDPGSGALLGDPFAIGSEPTAWGSLDTSAALFAGLAMVVSHGVSFFWDYLRRHAYLRISPERQMFAPYGRVVVLQVSILFGGIAIALIGSPVWTLVVFVVAKTVLDLSLDRRNTTFGHELTS